MKLRFIPGNSGGGSKDEKRVPPGGVPRRLGEKKEKNATKYYKRLVKKIKEGTNGTPKKSKHLVCLLP